MCGIAGFVSALPLDDTAADTVRRMTDAIRHRGPDDGDAWLDREAGVALGHRRLAIIDLTPTGHQPMASHDGRYVTVYNGEIYNFAEIREALETAGLAPPWRGRSDTEVLLAAICAWGLEEALKRTRGMFALALWDRQTRTLMLARDRMGEKPLYFGWQGQGAARTLIFGSELTALRQHASFEGQVDHAAIGMLARYLYVPDPHTVYAGISKVPAGVILQIDPRTEAVSKTTYWDSLAVAIDGANNRFQGSPEEAVDQLATILERVVGRQMVSDVPLGAFLSGGVDSSTVVALMQACSSRPVQTFTIGFEDEAYNEAGYARDVADHLKTDHTELVVTAADALAMIPDLPRIFSEPFADSSQIPTWIVSGLARKSVTVSLSGDGGDEVFGGYNRHTFAQGSWPRLSRVPRALRAGIRPVMTAFSPDWWDRTAGPLLGSRISNVGDKIHKAAAVIASRSTDDLYQTLISTNPEAARAMRGGGGAAIDLPSLRDRPGHEALSDAETMMALDAVGYLPGDVLTKVDRAAMAHSLETRVPFLDPEVFAFAWTLPTGMKIRDGVSKWPLRQVLYRHVPKALIERPKMGFGVPIGAWLRGPLKPWAAALLDARSLEDGGIFDPAGVTRLWDEHQSGVRNNQHQLWPILMAQAWLEHS